MSNNKPAFLIQIKKEPHLLIQLLVTGLTALVLIIFVRNYQINLASRNIETGFSFLDDTAGFAISQTLVSYDETSSYFRVYLVGLLNTLLITAISIALSTLLGLLIALARLSKKNWLLRKLGTWYVELFRNIPPLLHVLFWYQVFFLRILPDSDNPLVFFNKVFLNIRGVTLPEAGWFPQGKALFWSGFALVLVIIVYVEVYKKKAIRQGDYRPYWIIQLAAPLLLLVFSIIFPPFTFLTPEMGRFGFVSGVVIKPELISLVLALSSYSSVYIGESIRSSVEAVPIGQSEAARSLGLKRGQYMRLIILPQSLRTVIPPVISQYLNILKNSSLGVVIAYPDLVSVFAGSALNQVGRALEIIGMTMLTYFSISILISFLMNVYNRYLQKRGGT